MKQETFLIKSNKEIAPHVYEMHLEGDTSSLHAGQFVNIAIDGLYLRRPISVCDAEGNDVTLLYKEVGKGTHMMSKMEAGQQLDVLNELGNGFQTHLSPQKTILLAGGGIGIAPLYLLAKNLKAAGHKVHVALCFNKASEIFYQEAFEQLDIIVHIVTADGSKGYKGFITHFLQSVSIPFDYFYACGPMPMLKALCQETDIPGEVSLEARMGCGFGICMGCSIKTTHGYKRVCKEGPVFKKEELIW